MRPLRAARFHHEGGAVVEEGTPVVIVEGPPPPDLAPNPAVPDTPVTTIGDPEAPVDLEAG